MAKWFQESMLIKYWEDRCQNYILPDGTKITRAVRNTSFDRYPDIGTNVLSDGRVVPAEIEWLTTNFDRHGHDIITLLDNKGFLIVFKNDASFPLPQIEIDKDDFTEWFITNAGQICQETLKVWEDSSDRSKEPQVFLKYLPKGGETNYNIALQRGVWGFPANNKGVTRGLPKISQIKKGDMVIVLRNWTADPDIKVTGRPSSDKYIGTFEELAGLVVKKSFYELDKPSKIWQDNPYPYRFEFQTPPLFIGHNIPCNQTALGKSLHEILRRLQIGGSLEKIDSSILLKLSSLCINK